MKALSRTDTHGMRVQLVRLKFFWLSAALLLTGCALFSKDTGKPLPAGAFRGTAAVRMSGLPVPVEIATDLEELSKDRDEVDAESDGKSDGSLQTPSGSPMKKARLRKPGRRISSASGQDCSCHPLTKRKKFKGRSLASGKGTQKYVVRPGDTLMKIAFAKYGDIFRWRDIYQANRDILGSFNRIEVGAVLVIHGARFIVIEKNGEPYLIRSGDTLVGISNKVYGQPDQWRVLWNNNRQLIKDPNKIYAGFTIYYQPNLR